jgi:hypothetical protein
MAKRLKDRKVKSVAMESTGVYWIAPHEVLEAESLEVMLVDTRQLARVPGRDKKTDPVDCEWIQRLHSCGLLLGSFRPKEAVCMLRTLVRDKGPSPTAGGSNHVLQSPRNTARQPRNENIISPRRRQYQDQVITWRVDLVQHDEDYLVGALLKKFADGERAFYEPKKWCSMTASRRLREIPFPCLHHQTRAVHCDGQFSKL